MIWQGVAVIIFMSTQDVNLKHFIIYLSSIYGLRVSLALLVSAQTDFH